MLKIAPNLNARQNFSQIQDRIPDFFIEQGIKQRTRRNRTPTNDWNGYTCRGGRIPPKFSCQNADFSEACQNHAPISTKIRISSCGLLLWTNWVICDQNKTKREKLLSKNLSTSSHWQNMWSFGRELQVEFWNVNREKVEKNEKKGVYYHGPCQCLVL